MLRQLIKQVWSLCLLRSGPQDLPHSPVLTMLSMLGYGAMSVWQFMHQMSFERALTASIVGLLVMAAYCNLVLQFKGVQSRFFQTLAALFLTGLLLSVLLLPIPLLHPFATHAEMPKAIGVLFSIAAIIWIFAVNVWVLIVTAHIYRQALGLDLMRGLLVAIGQLAVTILAFTLLGKWLLPAGKTAATGATGGTTTPASPTSPTTPSS